MRTGLGIFLMVILLFGAGSCKHSTSQGVTSEKDTTVVSADHQPEITFTTKEHDFGKVTEGERVGWYFKFRNTGKSDLVITNASASCGCTIPDYDRQPVPPGGEGSIKVVFDSSGRQGRQYKTVTIETNAKQLITKLVLKANVVEENKY